MAEISLAKMVTVAILLPAKSVSYAKFQAA